MNRQVRLLPRFENREPELRSEWEAFAMGQRWDEVRVSFRLGWEAGLALGEREWDEVEPQLAACWPERHAGGWRQCRTVVRIGYERGQRERQQRVA